jgi:excisionase family DNA binding protein
VVVLRNTGKPKTNVRPTSVGWLDYAGVADRLGVSVKFAKRMKERGDVPHYKFGRLVRFRVEDIDAYAERSRVPHRVDASGPYAAVR